MRDPRDIRARARVKRAIDLRRISTLCRNIRRRGDTCMRRKEYVVCNISVDCNYLMGWDEFLSPGGIIPRAQQLRIYGRRGTVGGWNGVGVNTGRHVLVSLFELPPSVTFGGILRELNRDFGLLRDIIVRLCAPRQALSCLLPTPIFRDLSLPPLNWLTIARIGEVSLRA